MAKSSIRGFWAEKPTAGATQSVGVLSFVASFDPTSSSTIALGVIPKGGRPIGVISLGGSTGGSSPTVDIGISGNSDALANELPSNTYTEGGNGSDTGDVVTVDTEVVGKVGASAATGGTTTVIIQYIMA